MPFVAKDTETHQRIDITQYADPRNDLIAARLACQICDGRMIIRQGFVIRPHFAHTAACPIAYAMHPESPEHLLGKFHISNYLRLQAEFAGAVIELEVPIHERKRIADILVTFPQGLRLEVESQLASITPAELEARTKDYFDAGIDVIWVLGKSAAQSPSNKEWCRTVLGGFLQIAFTEHNEHINIAILDEL